MIVPTFREGQDRTRSGEGNSVFSFGCLISSLGYKLGAQWKVTVAGAEWAKKGKAWSKVREGGGCLLKFGKKCGFYFKCKRKPLKEFYATETHTWFVMRTLSWQQYEKWIVERKGC